ncbi:hypothetical protein H6F66_01050 [Trichocoleus sp. FACHB-6]|nr:hypothetical protein [Trichocoleus sp. FACHB-6]MBD1906822.1 hypothetical protein [Trichocoleus sp. FACHB-832]MBD2060877.1 hypothetical protein [Trichocoleus sp. FACHB-6]
MIRDEIPDFVREVGYLKGWYLITLARIAIVAIALSKTIATTLAWTRYYTL